MILPATAPDSLPDSSKSDGEVNSEKMDSGMDDDSQHSNESNNQQSLDTPNDSEDDDEVLAQKPSSTQNEFNTDIFDAEEDESDNEDDDKDDNKDDNEDDNKGDNEDDNEDRAQRDSGDDSASDSDRNKDDNDSDEGFNESTIDPKLLKKLKKGASKKPTSKSQRKAKQESLMSIHSETQRIVRESRVNLPYHQPEPKPLSAFLERASKKRESYRTVLHSRDIHKAKAMQDVFEKTRIQAQSHKLPADVVPKEKNRNDASDEKKTESPSKCMCHLDDESDYDSLAQDDLPDIGSERQKCDVRKNTCKSCTKVMDDMHEPLSSKTSQDNAEVQMEEGNGSMESKEIESATQCNIDSSASMLSKEIPVSEPYSALSNDEEEIKNDTKAEDRTEKSAESYSEEPNIESSNKCDKEEDKIGKQSENENSAFRLKKSELLAKLPELSAPPKLSGGPDLFIDFNDTSSSDMKYEKPGVNKLMDRFMKHSQKKKKHTAKDVDISIIEKEKTGEHEELKMKSFTYHPTEEDENSLSQLDVPGAKLMALKEKLKVSMKKKREEARKQRQDMYDLDNEEGGFSDGENGEEILDDDAEMSDKSDTDVDDEDFDEQFEDFEEEGEEEEKENNPFADDEAEESDDDRIDEDDKENNSDDNDEMELRLQLSDADDENEDSNITAPKSKRLQLSAKKKCRVLQISDDEDDSKEASRSASTKAQEEEQEELKEEAANKRGEVSSSKEEEEGTSVELDSRRLSESLDDDKDDFIPFSKHLSSAQYPARRKSSSLILPIENSQDLYGSTQSLVQLPLDTQKESQSFSFSLEESQSQMLDADGFLKVGSTAKKSSKPLNFGSCNIQETQDHMDELLGLCSGRFAGEDEERKAVKNLFGQGTQATQDNMGELLGLCSGKFSESVSQDDSSRGSGVKRKFMDDEGESNSSFQLESDDEAKSTKDAFSDNEDVNQKDDDDDEEQSGEDDQNSRDSNLERKKKFKGFTVGNKHGKIRKDFVEQEAELSGSEYDSDENLDLAEEEDVLEMEEGDKDAVGTEEELRNQVGRAHLKQVIDDDKKELLRFQEMYLPDGDLHSEGGGRIRRFKWSGVDDNTMQDMFDNDSDAENQEEEEQDAAWRKDRFEREKFLQEQQDNEQEDTEDSQFLKLGKVFLKRRDSDSGSARKVTNPVQVSTVKAKSKEAPGTPTRVLRLNTSRRGSFLSRDKNTLAKIAEATKATTVNPNGVKNSRNFVFQVISPDKDSDSQAMPAPKGTKIRKALKPRTDQPASKKPRLEKNSFSQQSVFHHL